MKEGVVPARKEAQAASALVPPPPWMTVVAFAIVVVPFAVILARLALASGRNLHLSDDLALIDLHTRIALRWKQQLGVFDRNGWNHPGPTYFYLLSLAYRVFGSGAKAMFIGATAINALAAVACVGVVRRRSTPARALWAAVWVCVLASLFASVGGGSVAFSEGALGGLVSPWNPMVVTFSLLLFILLAAAAADRSPLSLVAALVVGSFIVQTNISTLPLVAALWIAAFGVWVATVVTDRRRDRAGPSDERERAKYPNRLIVSRARPLPSRGGRVWTGIGLVAFVLMWLPPAVQELTNHPGNLTLIYRYFTAGYPGQSVKTGFSALVAINGILVDGPSEVMHANLAVTPHHIVAAVVVSIAVLVICAVSTFAGLRQRSRFSAGLGALGLIGFIVMIGSVIQLVGPPYGYLVVWAIAVPIAVLIGVGTLQSPLSAAAFHSGSGTGQSRSLVTSRASVRVVACLIGVGVSALLCVRVADIPPLSSVSDSQVGRLASLVIPSLDRGGTVFVNDSGAGTTAGSQLIDVEKFIGLVDELDQSGFHPRVNHFWRAEFGPGFEANGTESRSIELGTWRSSSSQKPGYLGRVGDLAVTLTKSVAGRSTDPADTPG